MPAGRAGQAAVGVDAAQARVRRQQHAGVGRDGEAAQQADELPHLAAVVLVAAEHVGGGVERDQHRLDLGGGLLQLLEQRRRPDDAGAIRRAEQRVLARERHEVQVLERRESGAEMGAIASSR